MAQNTTSWTDDNGAAMDEATRETLIHRLTTPDGAAIGLRGEYLDAFERRRSEEHTSELQSRFDLVCRLLLEKKMYYIGADAVRPAYEATSRPIPRVLTLTQPI